MTVELCTADNASQQFTYVPSTDYPFSTIYQGSGVVGTSGNSVMWYPNNPVGTGIEGCSASNPSQNISLVNGQIVLLGAGGNTCVSGACTDSSNGCYPLPFVACNSTDPNQQFTLTSSKTIVNKNTGFCLDIYYQRVRPMIDVRTHELMMHQGPQVGAYLCNSQGNQEWTVGASYVESVGLNGQCLALEGFSSSGGAQIVVNEFGNGEMTFYGADVIDVCIGVCVL